MAFRSSRNVRIGENSSPWTPFSVVPKSVVLRRMPGTAGSGTWLSQLPAALKWVILRRMSESHWQNSLSAICWCPVSKQTKEVAEKEHPVYHTRHMQRLLRRNWYCAHSSLGRVMKKHKDDCERKPKCFNSQEEHENCFATLKILLKVLKLSGSYNHMRK